MYHRKRQSVPVKALNIIHDRVNILRMRLGRLLRNADAHQENGFHRLDIDEYGGSPERIAQLIRAAWKLPMGPVKNLVGAIENAGGIVVPCSFGTTKLDAVSQWPRNMPPIFFINKDIPVDRWRFTLAHEVGHIVMHAIPTPNAEKEADRFASEFLMPERMIRHDLDNITLEKAAALKPYWRVSIQALFRRAKDVGKMTDRRYISLCAYISKLGYRKIEPVTIAPEEPTVLRNLIRFHREEHGFSVSDLGKLMLISEQELREQFLDEGACPLRVVS
jgi:Zn-dependent peptidase ImmA (M78 family)